MPLLRGTVDSHQKVRLPRSFLGLSTEYMDVGTFESQLSAFARVVGLLRSTGDGPLVLRIGGDSSGQTYWGRRRGMGRLAFHLTERWLHGLRGLTEAAHLRLLIDLNLQAGDPSMAARFARASVRTLPPHTVQAFEIGNEPDSYQRKASRLARLTAVPTGPLPAWRSYTPGRYVRAFRAYAGALQRAVPHVALAGPELASPGLNWLRALIRAGRSRLGMLSVHRYPLSACARPGSAGFASIGHLLRARSAWGPEHRLAPAVRVARAAGLPLRVTELNSISCQGRPGVSNTFATSLWAPDALFSLWRAGVSGVNIHVRPQDSNGAFAVSSAGLVPRPLLYGLLLFARTVAGRPRLLGSDLPGSGRYAVRTWAVQTPTGARVLALDEGPRPVRIMLSLPFGSPATVQRLLAVSPESLSGVTLAGQTLDPRGRWVGRRVIGHIRGAGSRHRSTYDVVLPDFSAALLSFGRR